MKKPIEYLVRQMQKLIENNNGTITGGYVSITNRINGIYPVSPNPVSPNPVNLNPDNCNPADSVNASSCGNVVCNGSTNGGYCINYYSCVNSTNNAGDPLKYGCGMPPGPIK